MAVRLLPGRSGARLVCDYSRCPAGISTAQGSGRAIRAYARTLDWSRHGGRDRCPVHGASDNADKIARRVERDRRRGLTRDQRRDEDNKRRRDDRAKYRSGGG